MNTPTLPVVASVRDAIRRSGRGKVFTSKDFLDLGSRDAVDQALSRLSRLDDIKRIGRGLYYYPRMNTRLGIPISPDADDVAQALARQTGTRVVPSGAVAANRLGLTTQVPGRLVYLTDGNSREVKAADLVFTFKHVAPKDFPSESPASAAEFQALRYLGRDAVSDDMLCHLKRTLPERVRRRLLDDARYTTDWVYDVVRRLIDQAADDQSNTEARAHGRGGDAQSPRPGGPVHGSSPAEEGAPR